MYAVTRLSRDWNSAEIDEAEREQLGRFFFEKREPVEMLGRGGRLDLRQRFILVSIPRHKDSARRFFEDTIIRSWLVHDSRVRSIYALETPARQEQFDFWIDTISNPYEADELVQRLFEKCSSEGDFEIGLRSMELMKHLLTESVEGIADTDNDQQTVWFYRRLEEAGDARFDMPSVNSHWGPVSRIAGSCHKCVNVLHTGEPAETVKRILDFHTNWFKGNFHFDGTVRADSLRDASHAWHDIYQNAEELAEKVRKAHVPDVDAYLAEHKINPIHFRESQIRLVMHAVSKGVITCRDPNNVGSQHNQVSKFRNDFVHGNRFVKALPLVAAPASEVLSDERWSKLIDRTNDLINLVELLKRIHDGMGRKAKGSTGS